MRYITPPTSYFSWVTTNSYADGTREFIYSDFYTITKGPAPPASVPIDAATNFEYNRIINIGLVDQIEYRFNGTTFSNFRNGSVAVYQNGKFASW